MWNLVVAPRLMASEQEQASDLPLCGKFEHNEGRWLPIHRHTARRPMPCCGWDRHKWGGKVHGGKMFRDDVEHCGDAPMATDPELFGASPSLQLSRAFWFTGGGDYLTHLGGYGCSCQKFGFQDSFRWIPDKCRLVEWDAREFCGLLGQRTILVVGDSTVSQAASVLMNYIHWDFWRTSPPGCQQQVIFANSDTLVGRKLGGGNRGGEWKDLVRHFNPDIIFISSGPHILDEDDFVAVIEQVAREHRALFPNKQLIWKTQAPAGCTQAISLTFPQSDFYHSLPYENWNWEQFEKRDWLAIRTFTGTNQHVLDLSPLYYRTDAHPGCFYYEGYTEGSSDTRPMRVSVVCVCVCVRARAVCVCVCTMQVTVQGSPIARLNSLTNYCTLTS